MDIVYIHICLYIVYFAMYMLSYLYKGCPAVGTKETSVRLVQKKRPCGWYKRNVRAAGTNETSVRLVLFTTQFRTLIFEVKCGFYTRSSIL